ncbi:MAG: hypothetical protein FWF07_00715, partial [Methanomassiliicoccaceae archaeon]|nr:hypothetical protein [Methanomassiliicoccaceae archaeon]
MKKSWESYDNKNGKGLFKKRSVLMYGLIALVMVSSAVAVVQISPGGSDNSSAVDGNWGGSGSYSDPYQIYDAADLAQLATEVNIGHHTFATAYFVMTNDIDLDATPYNEGSGWEPIGYSVNQPFSGNFDGNGYSVSNLFINIDTTDLATGLFGYLSGGIIENLGVIDANVTGLLFVGGVVGCSNGGTVENCYVTGAVEGTFNVGGVVGYSQNGTVMNCYNSGTVALVGSYSSAGGVVGNNDGTLENCYNTGNVISHGYAGGVVGYSTRPVSNCYNAGDVNGSSSVGSVGGVVGYTNSRLVNCYNTGAVGGASSAGGVVGDNRGRLESCYNAGAVGSSGSAGGVAGENNGTIVGCFFLQSQNTGEINFGINGIGNQAPNELAVPLDSDEMRTQDIFTNAGWNFTDSGPWGMFLRNDDPGAVGYGLPFIKTIKNFILVT